MKKTELSGHIPSNATKFSIIQNLSQSIVHCSLNELSFCYLFIEIYVNIANFNE